MSVAISVAVLLAIGSLTIGPAADRHGIQRRDCFESLRQKSQELPKAKAKNTSPPLTSDDPETMSANGRPSAALGRPLCVDREALAAMLIAGVFASSLTDVATNGCQTIPWNAQIDLLERYPSGLYFLRVIKVKMTTPAQQDSTVGFTIETGR